MKKTIYIFGCEGNMGRRYRAILQYMGHDWLGEDVGLTNGHYRDADGIIIATPTDTHATVIRHVLHSGKPILCEKPISKIMVELRPLMAECVLAGTRLQMVTQYDYLIDKSMIGPTVWDYWNSGKDGLAWDCIQVIAAAKQGVDLRNKSPTWHCKINGRDLNIAHMDNAYISMVGEWLYAPRNDISRILDAHEKVAKWEADQCKSES